MHLALPEALFDYTDEKAPPDLWFELKHGAGMGYRVAGVDEVGRGPLAGSVVACAVILPYDLSTLPEGITDSKGITARQRERLAPSLREVCAYAIGEASVEEIDTLNILQATFLAMRRAVDGLRKLGHIPDYALIDGTHIPPHLGCPATAIVDGDARSLSIAAASIIAKVTRDTTMAALATDFPLYGWERNAGYGTKAHLDALKAFGATPHHRKSFAPVANALNGKQSF